MSVEFPKRNQTLGRFIHESVDARRGSPQSDIDPKFRVSDGDDSYVYRYGDLVLKFYSKSRWPKTIGLKEDQLKFYMFVTNKAAELVRNEGWKLDFPNSGLTLSLLVNPILEVDWSPEYNCWVSISQYVGGRRLNESWNSIKAYEQRPILRSLSDSLDERLGVKGIEVLDLNVKFLEDGKEVVITDLCGSINSLKKED